MKEETVSVCIYGEKTWALEKITRTGPCEWNHLFINKNSKYRNRGETTTTSLLPQQICTEDF